MISRFFQAADSSPGVHVVLLFLSCEDPMPPLTAPPKQKHLIKTIKHPICSLHYFIIIIDIFRVA